MSLLFSKLKNELSDHCKTLPDQTVTEICKLITEINDTHRCTSRNRYYSLYSTIFSIDDNNTSPNNIAPANAEHPQDPQQLPDVTSSAPFFKPKQYDITATPSITQLVTIITSLPVFSDYYSFYLLNEEHFKSMLKYFNYKSFSKGEYIYNHYEQQKCFYILIAGDLEKLEYKCPLFLKQFIHKIKKHNLDMVVSSILGCNIEYLSTQTDIENEELNTLIVNKITSSSLGEELISKLLEDKYFPPKRVRISKTGALIGIEEIVNEIRRIKSDTTIRVTSNTAHVLYVDKDVFIKYISRNVINALNDKYDYIGKVLPCLGMNYKGKQFLRKARPRVSTSFIHIYIHTYSSFKREKSFMTKANTVITSTSFTKASARL